MINRRTVLAQGAWASLSGMGGLYAGNTEAATQRLQGSTHPKFVHPLPNPNAPLNAFEPTTPGGDTYVLRLREFVSQIGLVSPTGTNCCREAATV
ncbi:MAG: hypothetical protein RL260_2049 [Pseudomonadota bacterium]